jgi:hypothetical protein
MLINLLPAQCTPLESPVNSNLKRFFLSVGTGPWKTHGDCGHCERVWVLGRVAVWGRPSSGTFFVTCFDALLRLLRFLYLFAAKLCALCVSYAQKVELQSSQRFTRRR